MLSKAIKKMIYRFQGELLVINRLDNICTCASGMLAEPKPDCPHCFGTGHEVRIKKIKGVVNESNGPSTMRKVTDTVVTKEIYMDESYWVRTRDLIIFEKEVFDVYQIKTFRSQLNEPVYNIAYATPLKYDSHFIIENLKKVGAIK